MTLEILHAVFFDEGADGGGVGGEFVADNGEVFEGFEGRSGGFEAEDFADGVGEFGGVGGAEDDGGEGGVNVGEAAGGVGAVSYTHLDVYKRQPLNAVLLAALRLPFFILCEP